MKIYDVYNIIIGFRGIQCSNVIVAENVVDTSPCQMFIQNWIVETVYVNFLMKKYLFVQFIRTDLLTVMSMQRLNCIFLKK